VTFEIFPDERGHRPQWSVDEEIVDRAYLLQQYGGQQVRLLSDDAGMRARASSRGLQVRNVDDLLTRNQQSQP
jgi:hypothetical protein